MIARLILMVMGGCQADTYGVGISFAASDWDFWRKWLNTGGEIAFLNNIEYNRSFLGILMFSIHVDYFVVRGDVSANHQ